MKQISNGKIYDTETAVEVASTRFWNGRHWERRERNTFLYKTKKGNFFLYHTIWERKEIEPIDIEEAKEFHKKLSERSMSYKEAFGVEPEEV